jgi:hypothetical protein
VFSVAQAAKESPKQPFPAYRAAHLSGWETEVPSQRAVRGAVGGVCGADRDLIEGIAVRGSLQSPRYAEGAADEEPEGRVAGSDPSAFAVHRGDTQPIKKERDRCIAPGRFPSRQGLAEPDGDRELRHEGGIDYGRDFPVRRTPMIEHNGAGLRHCCGDGMVKRIVRGIRDCDCQR